MQPSDPSEPTAPSPCVPHEQQWRGWPVALQSEIELRGRKTACVCCASPVLAFFIEQADRPARHDRRNGVLVDELGQAVPSQQHAEIIEPSDNTLQFHTIDQKYRHRDLLDRKSTRLNSSHLVISYAVYC